MKGLLVIALALLGIASSEPIRHKFNSHNHISVRSPVGQCPEHDPANPVYLPDSDDCGFYYECSNGEPVENNCPPDLEFNPSKNVCTQCSESGCKAAIRHCSSEPTSTSTSDSPTSDTTTNDPPTSEPTTPPTISFYEVNGECPKHDTNESVILPDTQNCSIYYLCSNGRAIPLLCANGTLFNPEENVCVNENDYDCPLGVEEEEVISVRKPNGECPEVDPPMSAYLPDTEDCSIYYECSNGVPVQNVCPPGLAFNPSLHVCDEPTHAQCKVSSSSSTTTESASTESTTSS